MGVFRLVSAFLLTLTISQVRTRPQHQGRQMFEYVRGCYYTNWAQYRQGKGRYTPEHYIPGLCTHIFYAFVTMDHKYQLKPFEWNDESSDGTVGNYQRVNQLKQLQPGLKTLLSFGGYTFSQSNAKLLSKMAATNESRKAFITSVVRFIRERDFDGFDMDWEYPLAEDKENFAILLKETKDAFDLEAHETGNPRLLLTAAVAAGREKIDIGYNAEIMAEALDYVNVMTYDFHGSWETVTGFNSPLHERDGDGLAVSSAASHWVSKGIPRKKLLIGFGAYGRGWVLADASQNGVGAKTTNPSPAMNYTKEAGVAAYYELCQLVNEEQAIRIYDNQQQAPYMVKGNLWYGYDDEESIDSKLLWLKRNGYGGAFVWTLDQDDFTGQCPGGSDVQYPLISKLALRLGKELPFSLPKSNTTVAPVIPQRWSSSSSMSPTQQPFNYSSANITSTDFQCLELGLFADPANCKMYYNCGQSGVAPSRMSCGDGTVFNSDLKFCDWPYNVECVYE